MIKIIPGEKKGDFSNEIAQMHELRFKVFHQIKEWDVPTINRWEIDGYDALNPLYVLSLDEFGSVCGSFRLLPTIGFNMLNDTFPELLPEGKRIESPLIWECSRFAINPDLSGLNGVRRMAQTTAELGIAMNKIAIDAGLTHIVCVYEASMHRMLKAFDCAGTPLVGPVPLGKTSAYSVLYEAEYDWAGAIDKACSAGGFSEQPQQNYEHYYEKRAS